MRDPTSKAKAPPRVTLEIVGLPGGALSIYPETPLDAPPPPIFEGEVPSGGRLRLRVPRSPLLVVAAGFGTMAIRFDESNNQLTVDVRPGKPG
jgi:hypothetical protein